MTTTAVTPNPNGNPFDVPLNSEIQESQQRQAATPAKPSGYVNPFDEPLASEVAEQKHAETSGIEPSITGTAGQYAANAGGADITPVTKATNPKLTGAMPGADMPEYVGTTGALAAGSALVAPLDPIVTAVASHLDKLKSISDYAKKLGWAEFGINQAHDLYKWISKEGK